MHYPDQSARCSPTCGTKSRAVTAGQREDIGLAAIGALAKRRCAASGIAAVRRGQA